MSCKINISLLIFCLDDLSVDVSGVLKFSAVVVLMSASLFVFVALCFMCLAGLCCVHIY